LVCGRFVSEDPGRDGANWFAYCANNPVNGVDPDGHFFTFIGMMLFMSLYQLGSKVWDVPKLSIPGWLLSGLLWGDGDAWAARAGGVTDPNIILASYVIGFACGALGFNIKP
jgi:hypothetical protein